MARSIRSLSKAAQFALWRSTWRRGRAAPAEEEEVAFLWWGASTVIDDVTRYWVGSRPFTSPQPTAELGEQILPRAGTLRNLYVEGADSDLTEDMVVTVEVDGEETDLACTVTGGQLTGENTSDEVAVTAGQLVRLKSVTPAGGIAMQRAKAVCEYVPD